MRILIIHQNFPGQFRQLVPYLIKCGHEIMAICSHERDLPLGVKGWRYKPPAEPSIPMQLGQRLWYDSLERASSVAHICSILEDRLWRPDRILAHTGWGETLGINEVWPHVPQILWPELWTRPIHGGYGSDPQLPEPGLPERLEQLGRNLLTSAALDSASSWVMPTNHQAQSLPSRFRNSRLHVIHEGIDTSIAIPNNNISLTVRDQIVDTQTPVLTFVNRNLERLRGFDVFMRSLPIIQSKWPNLRVFIVGDNDNGYGHPHPSGQPLRSIMLEELQGSLNYDRIHFLGRIPHSHLISLFQLSWVHVYLSYPFVLGWSLLEAMSCGCSIIGSHGMPVEELIHDGVEGLLVPMDDPFALASRVSFLLGDRTLRHKLGTSARTRVMSYDQSVTLPLLLKLIEKSA